MPQEDSVGFQGGEFDGDDFVGGRRRVREHGLVYFDVAVALEKRLFCHIDFCGVTDDEIECLFNREFEENLLRSQLLPPKPMGQLHL